MTKISGFNLLAERLPAGSAHLVAGWLDKHPVKVRLCNPRNTKLGDYRPPFKNLPARISININMHPVEFLLTLTHELAHAENWQLYGRRVKPHGVEWKAVFRKMIGEILDCGFLDEKFESAVKNCYFRSEKLATSSCPALRRLYDAEDEGPVVVRLADIPLGSIFTTTSGKSLIKGEKQRTRYKCREAKTLRIYTVHPMADVVEFKPPKL